MSGHSLLRLPRHLLQAALGLTLRRLALATTLMTLLVACGSATVGGGYNVTTPTNIFDEALFGQLESNVVGLARVDLGGPSRHYLK